METISNAGEWYARCVDLGNLLFAHTVVCWRERQGWGNHLRWGRLRLRCGKNQSGGESVAGGCGDGGVAGGVVHEGFNVIDGADAAAGSGGGAVECGGCAGEVELAVEGPALQQGVDEAGVEDVAGAGGVCDGNMIGGAGVELGAVPGEDALLAEGGGGEGATEAALDELEGLFEIALAGEHEGKVAAGDEVVNVGDEVFYAGVELVEVGDGGDACLARPTGGEGGGGGLKAVDVDGAGVDDPGAVEVFRAELEAVVAEVEDGALAACVDEDDGLRAGGVGHGDEAGIDAGAGELAAVERGGLVVAELADVARAEAPGLAGDDGAGGLAAGEDAGVVELDLGAAGGIGGEMNQRVRGVEAHTDKVNQRRLGHGGIVAGGGQLLAASS